MTTSCQGFLGQPIRTATIIIIDLQYHCIAAGEAHLGESPTWFSASVLFPDVTLLIDPGDVLRRHDRKSNSIRGKRQS